MKIFPLILPAAAAAMTACSIPPSDATITIEAPTADAGQWHPVADYLDHRCGALDCHGDTQRNLVIYGCNGLRLSPTDIPGCMAGPNAPATTADEYNATYRSLVGLEPVVISQVVASGGQDPDNLTFVRKARGEENHKGGTLIVVGTDAGTVQDDCITSWLASATNTAACAQAIDDTP